MDPISVAGLVGDVFDTTVKVFKFLTALVDMPEDCQRYRLQLIIEYNRVLAWGKAAGLIDVPEGSDLGLTLGTNAMELVAVVARIQWLLAEFREIHSRYENEFGFRSEVQDDLDAQATDVLLLQVSNLAISYEKQQKERRYRRGTNHIRTFFAKAYRNTREFASHPSRIRWVAVDHEAFEALLKDLHVLVGRLNQLMGDYRTKMIDEITAKTYREMIIARNEVHDLKEMLEAVSSLIKTPSAAERQALAHQNDSNFSDLLRLKKISCVSELILSQLKTSGSFDLEKGLVEIGVTVPRYSNRRFEQEEFVWNTGNDEEEEPWTTVRPRGILKDKTGGEIPVWVEWKTMDDVAPESTRDKEARLRTIALAEMLHLPKPKALCSPTCIGYFDDREIHGRDRYGWIFRMPHGADCDTRVVSLYEILGVDRYKPTLYQRISLAAKLASSLLDLHTVNWLHKGIFSDNVLFHFNGDEFDPETPSLSGFEFSRPEGGNTTSRTVDIKWDLYRWPDLQREAPSERNSRKTYDIYSLGLVLLEIAHWKPLYEILSLGGKTGRGPRDGPKQSDDEKLLDVSFHDSRNIRGWLLGQKGNPPFGADHNPVGKLRHIVGEKYYRAVLRCIWGFGMEEATDHNPEVAIMLQESFFQQVVEELQTVNI